MLFISALLISPVAFSQKVDCTSEAFRDSLFEAFAGRAHQYSILDDTREMTFDSLLAICPNIAEAYQEKSHPYVASGDYRSAFENMNKAVALDSNRWTGYRGYLHCIYSKNYEKAVLDLIAAEKITPNGFIQDHTYAFFTALSYMELGEYAKAETYFLKDLAQQRRGEAKNDIHFNSFLYFGMLYYRMNEYDLAEKYFRNCLQLYEQHPMANYYLAMTLKVTGNSQKEIYFEKAKQYIQEGYKMNEPYTYVNFPHQITIYEIEQR